jgi:hypothetical protein
MALKSKEARRRQTAKATEAHPPLAVRGQRGGSKNRDRYFSLSLEEQWAIIRRMLIARLRAEAKRKGMLQPVLHSCEVRPIEGGGYELVEGSMRRMTQAEIDAL